MRTIMKRKVEKERKKGKRNMATEKKEKKEGDSKILDTENSFNEKTSCLDNSLHS